MRLSTLTESHELAARRRHPATTGIYLSPIEDLLGDRFRRAARSLLGLTGETDDPRVARFMTDARIIRWALAVDPIPLSESYSFAYQCHSRMLETSGLVANSVSHSLSEAMSTALTLVDQLVARKVSPLGLALLEDLVELGADTVVVVPRGAAAPPVEQWLDENGARVKAVLPPGAAVLGDCIESSIICLGSPSAYEANDRNYLQSILLAPTSDSLTFNYPSWAGTTNVGVIRLSDGLIEEDQRRSIFGRVDSLRNDRTSSAASEEQVNLTDDLEYAYEIDLDTDALALEESLLDDGSAVDCVRIDVAMGFHIYVEEDADRIRGVQICNGKIETRMIRLDSLAVGDYLVSRVGVSEAADLRGRAFELLGDEAPRIIDSQERWKSKLILESGGVGWAEIAARLKDRGNQVTGQEKRWASALAIRPRHDQDFLNMMEYLKFDPNEAETLLKRAKRLDSAVRTAARVASRELLDAVSDVRGIESQGGVICSSADSSIKPILIARVVEIDNSPRRVSLSMIRRALRATS